MKRKEIRTNGLSRHLFRVDALANGTVLLYNCFAAFWTAIATVVVATAIVVVVIAVSVAHICFGTTLAIALLLLFRVNARAVFAVSFDNFWETAVTTIIFATAVVIFIVTVAIANIGLGLASTFATRFRVLALADFAVSFDNFCETAVAAVIVTLLDVVSVITVAIAFVGRHCAANLGFRVQAFAHFAVGFFDGWTAAITTIPATVLVVVLVVAVFIALVIGSTTRWFVTRVQAFADFAVSFLHHTTAVTAIICTAFVVVLVVAIAVTFVFR